MAGLLFGLRDLWASKGPSEAIHTTKDLSRANRALQGTDEASTTSWMTGDLGRSLAILVTTLSGSSLRMLDIGDRHGARGPMSEHPGFGILDWSTSTGWRFLDLLGKL